MFDEFRANLPLRSVYWKDLRPGLVFAGGLSINGGPPPELAGFPVLDPVLVRSLHERYRLAPERKVLVLGGDGGPSPTEISAALRAASSRLAPLNDFRRDYRRMKERQPRPELPVWDSAWVERGTLIWPLRGAVPTLLADLQRDLGLAELLNREVFTRFNLPADRPIMLHLAVDQSFSMQASGKDEVTRGTVELFRARLGRVLPAAETLVYAFSDECRLVSGSLSGREVKRAGTDFAAFGRAVLRRQRPDRSNALLVFTDGLPGTQAEALRELERLSRAGFFYTQIVFNLAEDRRSFAFGQGDAALDGYFKGDQPEAARELSAEEYRAQEEGFRKGFIELAHAAGGNQLIINVDDALGVAAVEVFDRWYGGLAN